MRVAVCVCVRECRLPIRNVEQTNEIRRVGAVAVTGSEVRHTLRQLPPSAASQGINRE